MKKIDMNQKIFKNKLGICNMFIAKPAIFNQYCHEMLIGLINVLPIVKIKIY